MDPASDHGITLSVYRLVLALVAVVVPAAGVMAWSQPMLYDVFAVRLVFAAAAVALFAGSFTTGPMRTYLRELILALSWAMVGWYLWVARQHGMSFDDVVGLVPLVLLSSMMVRRPVELGASVAMLVLGIVATYAGMGESVFPMPIVIVIFGVLLLPLGWMSISRARLETELSEANRDLEQRVLDRTAALEASEAEARRASAAKSVFLANMSHELRTPITAILGFTELALEELEDAEDVDAQVQTDLQRSVQAARHLLALIDDLLDIARIEEGQLELQVAEVPVAEVTGAAARLVATAVSEGHNELRVDVPEALSVRADARRLQQVLVNLLSNAAKFTREGTISVSASQGDGAVRIAVSDTGIGIEPGVLGSIFDRFSMADDSSTRVHGGAGLGLALSHELVTRMGGRIEVASTPGAGSTFTVVL